LDDITKPWVVISNANKKDLKNDEKIISRIKFVVF
jgi:hypothetical protein